jgi:Na+/pantothenate symporter
MVVSISLDVIIIAIVTMLTAIVGLVGYRISRTFVGYMFANKSLGPWLLAFSIMATYFSAASFLGGGGATYIYNLGFGAWLTAWHVIGVVVLWIVVADKLYRYVSKAGVLSIPELIGYLYRSTLARLIAATVIVALFNLYLVSVYRGGGIVLSTMFEIDYKIALLILTLPAMVCIILGGMKSAAISNLFLGVLMLIAAALTFTYIMTYVGGLINGLSSFSQISVLGISGTLWLRFDGAGPRLAMEKGLVPILIMSVTFSIGMAQTALPNLLIQFYAAKNSKAISRGRLIGPILVSLYAFLMFSLGMFCHLVLDKNLGDQQIAELMKNSDFVIPKAISLLVPIGIRGLILSAPVAASISTITVTILTITNTFIRDVIQVTISLKEVNVIRLAKIFSIIFSFMPMTIALIEDKLIIDVVSAAFGTIFACFVGPVTIGLYWRKATKEGAIGSMVVGALTGILWYIYLYRSTMIHSTIPATLLALGTFIILSILTNRKNV